MASETWPDCYWGYGMALNARWIRALALALALLALPLALALSVGLFPDWTAHSRLKVTPFSWYNLDGEPVLFGESKAPFTLLFLGFLSCDSVCPVRLARMANIARQRDQGQLQLLFLTLDAARDTPDKRRRLVDALGIDSGTLTPQAMQRLRLELGDRAGELDRHSPRVYLLNRKGKILEVFLGEDLNWPAVQQRIGPSL